MARDVILPSFAMESCANSCRTCASQRQFTNLAAALLLLGGHACAAEREDFTEPALAEISLVSAVELAQCEDALRAHYEGTHYDARLILQCSDPDCAGTEWVAAEGHRVVNVFTSLALLIVDVGRPEQVFHWACRYPLDPAYQHAFSQGFPNLTLDLR